MKDFVLFKQNEYFTVNLFLANGDNYFIFIFYQLYALYDKFSI